MRIKDFQTRVAAWLPRCFEPAVATSRRERVQRFLEEALELAQAEGLSRADIDQMADYVLSREAGELDQEVGGVSITLAALCANAGIDLEGAAMTELERIERPEIIDKIRTKHARKEAQPGLTSRNAS